MSFVSTVELLHPKIHWTALCNAKHNQQTDSHFTQLKNVCKASIKGLIISTYVTQNNRNTNRIAKEYILSEIVGLAIILILGQKPNWPITLEAEVRKFRIIISQHKHVSRIQ